MSKTAKPAPGPVRRKLLSQQQANSVAGVCIACAWRKTSNAGLRELRANNDDFTRDPYSGILAGFHKGQIIVAEYAEDRQIGFIAIPIQHFAGINEDIVNVYKRAVEQIQAEVEANLAAQEEDTPEGESDEEAGETEAEEGEDDSE